MNYVQFVLRLADALGDLQRDVNLPLVVPNAIELAESRCYRDLQLLAAVTKDTTTAISSTRDFTLPSNNGTFITVTEVNVVTPVGATTSSGLRNPLTRVSPRMVNFIAPTDASSAATSIPQVFAMHTDAVITCGPSFGSSFTVEVVGTIRPTALSSGNSSTYLTSKLPDLFFSAAMSAVCYSLGDKATDKQQYWETTYQSEYASANMEEAKKRYMEYYTVRQVPVAQDTHGALGMPG